MTVKPLTQIDMTTNAASVAQVSQIRVSHCATCDRLVKRL